MLLATSIARKKPFWVNGSVVLSATVHAVERVADSNVQKIYMKRGDLLCERENALYRRKRGGKHQAISASSLVLPTLRFYKRGERLWRVAEHCTRQRKC